MASLDRDDLAMLADSVARYVNDSPAGSRRDAAATWRECAELGWLGIGIANDDGGLDGGAAGVCAILRGAGRGLVDVPLLSGAVLAATVIGRAGDADQRAALLGGIAAGELKIAVADREPRGGHDHRWVETRAERDGDGYRLTGAKQFVLDHAGADKVIVPATLDDALTLFVVDAGAAGLSALDYRGADARPVSDLTLDGVAVAAGDRLPGDAAAALDAGRALAALGACAEAAGITEALNAITLDYLKTRKQFGVTIGSFQALQHRMVEMTVDQAQMTALVDRAATLVDAGDPEADRWVSAAKALCDIASRRIGEGSVQLHGGMGMTEELIVGHYLKRLLTLGSLFGDREWHLDRMAA